MLTTNATYYNASYSQYISSQSGPLTVAHGNSAAFLSLQTLDSNTWQYVWDAATQNPWQYLPAAYNNDPSLLAGYLAQKLLTMKAYTSPDSGVMELPFGGSAVQAVALEKPLSRGTITINSTDPLANPVVDYGCLSNPVDAAVSVAMLKFVRKFMATSAMQTLGPVELVPGSAVTSDADIENAIRSALMTPTFAHPSCSCSMMPLMMGGVVGPDLLVYGTKHLSIVDASIIPLIPATHLQSTVYAVAEKAADVIKKRA
jgi:choline dehydrogenase-like flavoprotein